MTSKNKINLKNVPQYVKQIWANALVREVTTKQDLWEKVRVYILKNAIVKVKSG